MMPSDKSPPRCTHWRCIAKYRSPSRPRIIGTPSASTAITSPGFSAPTLATGCQLVIPDLGPHGELAATRIDEMKPLAAGELVARDDRRSRRSHRELALREIVGVENDERATRRGRRIHESEATDEPRTVDLGVLRAVVLVRPPECRAVERLRTGQIDYRELEIVDRVMATHGGREYYVSVASPSALSP